MMGAGKSTIGPRVAAGSGRAFVDVDRLVGDRAGKSLWAIFAEDGEPAFRRLESDAIRELATDGSASEKVIATGGGSVLDPANVAAMRDSGVVAWLDASPKLLAERTAGSDRPLLEGEGQDASLAELMPLRGPLYRSAAHYRVDASAPVDTVAGEVSGCGRFPLGGSSEVLIGPGLPQRLLPPSSAREQAVIICQAGSRHVAEEVLSLVNEEADAFMIVVPDRDEAKSLNALERLYHRLAERNLGRHDTVVGVGGGAVTDLSGFLAATWLRGIESVYVPTTFLGAVDASIGGKTGINVMGKNLVGSFWHPSRVAISLPTMRGLPEDLLREGAAEAVKAGFIADRDLVRIMTDCGLAFPMAEVTHRAVAVKTEVVAEDFREQGRRAILNFGHTLGHGIEVVSALSHGHAVSVGMVAAAAISAEVHGFDPTEVVAPLERLGLPTSMPGADPEAVLRLVRRDKKRTSEGLRMVLLRDLADPVVEFVDDPLLRHGLAAVGIS